MSGFQISISEQSHQSFSHIYDDPATDGNYYPRETNFVDTFRAQYVKISLYPTDALSICEVQIFAGMCTCFIQIILNRNNGMA